MKHNKNRQIFIILFLIGILIFELVFYVQKKYSISTFSVDATTQAEIKDELIIALFQKNIIADSNKFYDKYFSDGLEYFNYEFKIKEVSKQGTPVDIYITFETTPVTGAHWPVGDDEITYKVDVFGKKKLVSFAHKKSYEIPEWLQNYLIRPYPDMMK
jgi:hypothetical protein